jgi:hypothetical protein
MVYLPAGIFAVLELPTNSTVRPTVLVLLHHVSRVSRCRHWQHRQ